MKKKALLLIAVLFVMAGSCQLCSAKERVISRQELVGKMRAFWIGQLVGNYMGYPFEGLYQKEPMPFVPDRYYSYRDFYSQTGPNPLRMRLNDARGFVPVVCEFLGGAFSDDDTDIEFVTLHAVEKYGLDITYPEITEMWKKCVNRKIWCANSTARKLMSKGLVAPDTGRKENNKNWCHVDCQIENEIWGAFYPGMTKKAAEWSLWGARITNDDWGTHPSVAFGVMFSVAFFEKDVKKLVQMGLDAVPGDSPFAEGVRDMIKWHKQYPNWRDARKEINNKYVGYHKKESYKGYPMRACAVHNALSVIMSVLYGQGDFMKTVGIAVAAGYDNDCSAATVAGLLAVINGEDCIPEKLTSQDFLYKKVFPYWTKPFNDRYVNTTRDNLPAVTKITDIGERIANIAEKAILANGGKKIMQDGQEVYIINCDF